MSGVSGARCALHPAATAVDICQRCGNFVCGECLELQGNDVLCSGCAQRQGVTGKASGQAVASLVLGLIGVLTCFLLPGVVGLVLANRELDLIEKGQAPAAGRNLAQGGRILGWINVGILGVLIVVAGVAIVAAMN